MSKIRNFAEIAPNIGFTEFDFYDLYRSTFEKSELGRIKRLLPLREMAENFGLVRKKPEVETGTSFILHAGRKGGLDVSEDVHRTELPETDGTVERQHSLPDVLRCDNRP